ncbi:uncharacterized protein LOC135705573 [Ochlerotatus camptorhynchus]|uniref:uncharacterized protein LOC135705573 n=1 Tax=Ochlerotatus camptorhynchus TaxID=644619 RepID=UPI0031DEB3A5
MENGKAIWLVLTIAWLVVLVHSGQASSDGSLQSEKPAKKGLDLNATVSQVIQAMGDSPYHGDSSQEHSKKGRIFARKGVDMNVTTAAINATSAPIVDVTVPKASEAQQLSNITTSSLTPPPPQVNSSNSTVVGTAGNATVIAKANSTMTTTPPANNTTSSVIPPAAVVPSSSTTKPTMPTTTPTTSTSTTSTPPTTTTTTTSTTSTTTTTTTTTTTKPPKKPKITYSVDDEPKLLQAAKPGYNSAGSSVSDANGRLHVEEPLAELSKEYIPPALMGPPRGHREYVVPVVTLIFAIPLLMGLFLLSYRRAKEFWLTRHYRRMDFLVDGMYNY